jgi:hypothetical protein
VPSLFAEDLFRRRSGLPKREKSGKDRGEILLNVRAYDAAGRAIGKKGTGYS